MIFHNFFQLFSKQFSIEQVAYSQTATRDLVFIRRSNTTASCTNSFITARFFTGNIKGTMEGKDQRTRFRDQQTFLNRNSTIFQHVDLFHQGVRCKHHTVANNAFHIIAQDTRWDQMKNGFFTVDNQGMTSIVAALIANYIFCLFC